MTAAENRPPFKVNGLATIKHLNIRKEGPDDEKILAVDVKLEIKGVDRRLCAYFDDALEAFLWRGDTDALIVRNTFLAPIQYGHGLRDATVEIEGDTFTGCEVKKFAIEPRDGGVMTLTLAVSLYPGASDVSELAELVQDSARVSIEGPPDLFAGTAPAPDGNVVLTLSAKAETTGPLWPATPPAGSDDLDGASDPLLAEARDLVVTTRRASISLVQRQLKIGYNRAARLIEQMETEGLVSRPDGSGARKVLGMAA